MDQEPHDDQGHERSTEVAHNVARSQRNEPDTYQQYAESAREKRRAKQWRGRVREIRRHARFFSEIAVLILTLGIIVVTCRQTVIMDRQNDILGNQSDLMSKALRETVVSNETTQRGQRPWVLLDLAPLDNPATRDVESNWATQTGLGIFVRNFGMSPAVEVSWSTWTDWWDVNTGNPPVEFLPAAGWQWRGGSAVVPPGQALQLAFRFGSSRYVDGERVSADPPPSGTYVVALASMFYMDQYGERHRTIFCAVAQIGGEHNPVQDCEVSNYAD